MATLLEVAQPAEGVLQTLFTAAGTRRSGCVHHSRLARSGRREPRVLAAHYGLL
jgi:hypothetical protein